ncbi:HDOD domain-containing protein [Maridesulfovibrio hydrothermalis]|uniref:Metal dependent phosphohydrolase n=1 Tax=Maridesulfovibrio hydrothermalis AM13 = DSM 14728 TaxID=1121451 RepID=L0R706_9BACT|nr:HDOD domain-containing protein [Maridesulfovibrio hydrothermalis]CCO22519.1 Metal dependent phosphohydrolase [Maridesulfovibrio hydrothermalis AM13 = DSM 14728]
MTDNIIPEETLQTAIELMDERFAHTDRSKPVLSTLYELGLAHVAKDLISHPELYKPQTDLPIPNKKFEKVDPVTLMHTDIKLPSLPQVFIEMRQVINNPASSASDVADVISQDTALSAFLLRMVNSAFYSFPSQIDTISRAVAVIGTKQLSTLALGTSVMDMFKGLPTDIIDLELFWRHSFACGIIASQLAKMFKQGSPEKCFVAGLLHDIGRPVLMMTLPDHAVAATAISRQKKALMFKAERVVTGFDHAELGGMLLRKWNLPFSLVTAVLYHHSPTKAAKTPESMYVYFANIIAKTLGIGGGGDFFIRDIKNERWENHGLTPEKLRELDKSLAPVLEDAFSILTSMTK